MMAQASPDDRGQFPRPAAQGPKLWQRGLALAAALAISAAIFIWRERLAGLGAYGYPGIFLVSLIGNATLVLPAPSLAVVFAAGSSLYPPLVGLAAGTGEALGELTGYLAGASGSGIVENQRHYAQIQYWMKYRGLWVIFFLSLVPNPLFDLAGISAGALGMPVWRFLIACWAGKVLKTTLVAWAGLRLLDWLAHILN